jgi:hypothetical protein
MYFQELGRRYMSVCRGSDERIVVSKQNLHCFFVANNTVTKLFRYKGEILNIDPPIYVFHDVMSDQEIQELINLSQDSV